jgi:hypothetical protein
MGSYMVAVFNIVQVHLGDDGRIPWQAVKNLHVKPDGHSAMPDQDGAREDIRGAKRKHVPGSDGNGLRRSESGRPNKRTTADAGRAYSDADEPQWETIEEDGSQGQQPRRVARGQVTFINAQVKRHATEEVDELDDTDESMGRDEAGEDSEGVLSQQCQQCLKAGPSPKRRTPAKCMKKLGFSVCDRCHELKFKCSLKPQLSQYRRRCEERAVESLPAMRGRSLTTAKDVPHSRPKTRSQSRSSHRAPILRSQPEGGAESEDELSDSGEYQLLQFDLI